MSRRLSYSPRAEILWFGMKSQGLIFLSQAWLSNMLICAPSLALHIFSSPIPTLFVMYITIIFASIYFKKWKVSSEKERKRKKKPFHDFLVSAALMYASFLTVEGWNVTLICLLHKYVSKQQVLDVTLSFIFISKETLHNRRMPYFNHT